MKNEMHFHMHRDVSRVTEEALSRVEGYYLSARSELILRGSRTMCRHVLERRPRVFKREQSSARASRNLFCCVVATFAQIRLVAPYRSFSRH